MASLTAVAGILSGIAALLPATSKQYDDTALAWSYWKLGRIELAHWDLESGDQDKQKKRIQKATEYFTKCASDDEIYKSDAGLPVAAESGEETDATTVEVTPSPSEVEADSTDASEESDPTTSVDVIPPPPRLIF